MVLDAARLARDDSTQDWHEMLAARRGGRPETLPRDNLFAPLLAGGRGRPFVVAQLGQSLDGRIANAAGESRYINCTTGLAHLHRLRALSDAVVIGASTAVADDPRLDVRHVDPRAIGRGHPARVVLDPRGRVPAGLKLFRDDGARRIAVLGEATEAALPAGVEVVRLPHANGGFAPAAVVAALARIGLRCLLVEGGAETVSRFLDAGVIDRLHLMVAPVLLGDGPSGVNLRTPRRLSDCVRPPTRLYHLGGDVLFDCDLSPAPAQSQAPASTSAREREQVDMADPQFE